MLIDCDTCTARGHGLRRLRRHRAARRTAGLAERRPGRGPDDRPRARRRPASARRGVRAAAEDVVVPPPGVVVEFDEVERRAVRALADVGLVPPLRHRGRPPATALDGGRRTG